MFQYAHHGRWYESFLDNLSTLYLFRFHNILSACLANSRYKIPIPILCCIYFPEVPLGTSSVVPHDLIARSLFPSSLFVPGNTEMIQSMLGTSYSGSGLVIHFTHWYMLWFVYPCPNGLFQDTSKSHSKWTTALLVFIPMSNKYSYTGTPTYVTTDTDIYGSQYPFMFIFLPWFVGIPTNLNCGRFTTVIDLYLSILSFVIWHQFWVICILILTRVKV